MITSSENKYKDRTPLETVEIIHNFFTDYLGLEIERERDIESESGTWWCHLKLHLPENNIVICTSNGKGATHDFSLASGYAELYERFCVGINTWLDNPFTYQMIKEKNLSEKGYYLHPEEKKITFDDEKEQSIRLKNYLNTIDTEDETFARLYEKICGPMVGMPFKSLTNPGKTYYHDPGILVRCCGSDGLAAGNTYEEALVQGCSEIFEHYVWDNICYPLDKYYAIDLEAYDYPQYLRDMITKIRENQKEIYIYDLSYNFNIPVVMCLIIDKKVHRSMINLSGAPVFDIAFERVITEAYQGRTDMSDIVKINNRPGRDGDYILFSMSCVGSSTERDYLPEEILLNMEYVPTYNHEVFLDSKDRSNEELLDHLIGIAKKNGWDLCWTDHSQIPEVKAIQIFANNVENFHYILDGLYKVFSTDTLKKSMMRVIENYYDKYDKFLKTGVIDSDIISVNDNFIALYENLVMNNKTQYDVGTLFFWYINNICFNNFSTIYGHNDLSTLELIPYISSYYIDFNRFGMFSAASNTPYISSISRGLNLYNYIACGKYTREELRDFFEKMEIDYVEEDFDHITEPFYFAKRLFYDVWYKEMHSAAHEHYLNAISGRKYNA